MLPLTLAGLAIFVVGGQTPGTTQITEVATLSTTVDQPAYLGEPIWITADAGPNIRYPFRATIENIGCNQIELKRDGALLKPLPLAGYANQSGIACGSAAPPGSPPHRLPLHALFVMDQPGTYSVRWTELEPSSHAGTARLEPLAQSDWMTFQVQQPTAEQRDHWLQTLLVHPPQDPGHLAGDFLPSLVAAAPDPRALQTFVQYLHADNAMVSGMAAAALTRFPLPDVRHAVVETLVHDGPSDQLAHFATQNRGWTLDEERRVVRAVIPYLQPSKAPPSPAKDTVPYAPTPNSAALTLLRFIFFVPNGAWPADRKLEAYANAQVLQAAPNIIANADARTVQELSENLGSMSSSARTHELLVQISQRSDTAGEQARIALTWHHQPADLPRLAAVLTAPGDADPRGTDRSTLPASLIQGFGDAALPYLERAVATSPYVWVRTQSAEQLALHNRPAGFKFLLEAVEGDPPYRAEVVRWVRDSFGNDLPRNATEQEIAVFLRKRMGDQSGFH